jgi:hypothetical protein
MTISIKEFCNHDPAVAIDAMIRGLSRHQEITNFRLNLDFEATWENEVCFGSAATLTLVELLDYSFVPPEFESNFSRAAQMETSQPDLIKFETAIVLFSKGFAQALAKYFEAPSLEIVDFGWRLENRNWEGQLPQVIGFWEQLSNQKFCAEKSIYLIAPKGGVRG